MKSRFWPTIPHDSFHLVGIAYFCFSRNLFPPFLLLFLALLVIIKLSLLSLSFIFLKSKCPIFHFVYLDRTIFHLICKCAKKSKIYINYVFSFSSKNPRRTLEPLSTDWHKNRQPTCYQLGARLCWKMKNIQNSKVNSNFSLLISFGHNASLQTTS